MNKEFIKFLIETKKSTYADDTSNGSKDYEYKKDNMTYKEAIENYRNNIQFVDYGF